jgi:hypothetical protein
MDHRVLFVCAIAAASACFPVRGQEATPEIRQFDIPTLEALAAGMYAQDQEAWKATDALFELHPQTELAREKVAGWLVESRPGGDFVRFFRDTGNGLEAAYDVSFAPASILQVSVPADRAVTDEERGQFAARTLAGKHITQKCAARYNSIVLKDPENDDWLVWLMAATTDPNAVMMGQHYRFTISRDGSTILRQDALSRSCMTLSKSAPKDGGGRLAGLLVTQLVSNLPVETTLFLSLQHHMPFFVATPDNNVWKVDQGKIEKLDLPSRGNAQP